MNSRACPSSKQLQTSRHACSCAGHRRRITNRRPFSLQRGPDAQQGMRAADDVRRVHLRSNDRGTGRHERNVRVLLLRHPKGYLLQLPRLEHSTGPPRPRPPLLHVRRQLHGLHHVLRSHLRPGDCSRLSLPSSYRVCGGSVLLLPVSATREEEVVQPRY